MTQFLSLPLLTGFCTIFLFSWRVITCYSLSLKSFSSCLELVELIASVIVFYMQNKVDCKNQAILANVVGALIFKLFNNLMCHFKCLTIWMVPEYAHDHKRAPPHQFSCSFIIIQHQSWPWEMYWFIMANTTWTEG